MVEEEKKIAKKKKPSKSIDLKAKQPDIEEKKDDIPEESS